MAAPTGGDDALPEEERGLGVTSLLIDRLKREEISRLCGQLRDLGVEEFVAIGCKMVAPESRAVDDESKEESKPADDQRSVMVFGVGGHEWSSDWLLRNLLSGLRFQVSGFRGYELALE